MKLILVDVDSTVVPFRIDVLDEWGCVDEGFVADLSVESRMGLLRQGAVLDLVSVVCDREVLWVDSGLLGVLQELSVQASGDDSLVVLWLTQRVANGGVGVGDMLNDAFGVDFGVVELSESLFSGDDYFLRGKIEPGLEVIKGLRRSLPEGEVLEVLWLDDDFVEFPSCRDVVESVCDSFGDVTVCLPVIDYWLGACSRTVSQFVNG